jgi:hypothetical protein
VSDFIDYFIKRVNTLSRMAEDLEFIAVNKPALERIGLPEDITVLRMIPLIFLQAPRNEPDTTPVFLVKRKDTGKHEDWLEDYELDPEPAWDLMVIINERRRSHARGQIVRGYPVEKPRGGR